MRNNKKRTKKKSKIEKIIMGTLSCILIILLIIGLAGIIVYKSGEMAIKASANAATPKITVDMTEVNRIKENLAQNNGIAWNENWIVQDGKIYEYREDAINFLLLGIDHGGKLSNETVLSDWKAGQADTIFLVSLNQEDKKISIIGIPRNSMVNVEIYNSDKECIDTIYNQICLQYGYAGGGELGLNKMQESVSELFYGLPIHGTCAVSFDAISVITEKLGGIEVVVPDDMTGYNSAFSQGSTQLLTKRNVVGYLRYREYNTLGSPTTRLERQKEFMKIASEKVLHEIQSKPIFVKDIYEALTNYMNTDISVDKAVYVASKAIDCKLTNESFYQLTGEDKAEFFINQNGNQDFYDDYYLNEEDLKKVMLDVFYKEVTVTN